MRSFPMIPIWLMSIVCILSIGFIAYNIIKTKKIKKYIIDILIIVLLFVINLRFMIPTKDNITASNNLDVLFVIDSTISMIGTDTNDGITRLEAIKKDTEYITKELYGSRFSVISFNQNVKREIPFTKDVNLVNESISIIKTVDELYAKGTSLNAPVDEILSNLEDASKKEDRIRIIFIMTDGEITDDSKIEGYDKISKYVNGGAVLGYGTTKGSTMKYYDKYLDKDSYILDRSSYPYQNAITKLDEDNLKKIAKDVNVDYIHMTSTKDIDDKIKEIKNMSTLNMEKDDNDKKAYNDIYQYFLIPLLVLLIIKYCSLKGEWL